MTEPFACFIFEEGTVGRDVNIGGIGAGLFIEASSVGRNVNVAGLIGGHLVLRGAYTVEFKYVHHKMDDEIGGDLVLGAEALIAGSVDLSGSLSGVFKNLGRVRGDVKSNPETPE